MIGKLRGPLRRAYGMEPLPGAYHNLLLQPEEVDADIPDYIVRSAVAASVGGLLLVLGILLMVLDGFSFLNLIPFLPVFPGTAAIVHSLRVRRCLDAGDTTEARRASNYAETWARISLFTFVGMVVSGVLWLIAFTIVIIILAILAIVALIATLFVLGVIFGVFGALSGGDSDSGGSSRPANRGNDDDDESSGGDGGGGGGDGGSGRPRGRRSQSAPSSGRGRSGPSTLRGANRGRRGREQ